MVRSVIYLMLANRQMKAAKPPKYCVDFCNETANLFKNKMIHQPN